MPERRWRKLRATRSALSRARAGPATVSRGLALRHALAVLGGAGDLDGGREFPESGFGQGEARDHQRFAGAHHRPGQGGFRHGGQGGHIAAADVLGQGESDGAPNLFCGQQFHVIMMDEKGRKQKTL